MMRILDLVRTKYEIKAAGEEYAPEMLAACVDGFRRIGYQAQHKTYNKMSGVFFEVRKRNTFIDRLWIEDVMEYGDGDINVFVVPELNTEITLPKAAPLVIALKRQAESRYRFVDMTNVEAWLKKVEEGEPEPETKKEAPTEEPPEEEVMRQA